MDSPPQILWVNDDLDGPENGLALYQGEKLWFVRNTVPPLVSSVPNVPVPPAESSVNYTLIRLTPALLDQIEADHIAYCEASGAPLRHGDPIKIKRNRAPPRIDFSKVGPEGVEVEPVSMGHVKIVNRSINYQSIFGDYVATVASHEFENLNVPRRVEYV
jgi:hypothetical protein